MASTGREISIEQSHLLQRGNVSAVSCTYHPKAFTMSLQAPGLLHPDQVIGSGWHLMNNHYGRYQPVSFDTRYGNFRKIEFYSNNVYYCEHAQAEDRFALGLTSSAVYNATTTELSHVYQNTATKQSIEKHTGHWYNEAAAIRSAVESAQVQIAKNLLNDANFLDRLQEKYSFDDPVLAQAEIVRQFNKFPVFIGKEGEKSNTYLCALLKEVMLSDNDFSIFDDEFLTHIQYDMAQLKDNHPFLQTTSRELPPLEERLAARGQPLIVHPNHRHAVAWCSDTITPVLPNDLKKMKMLFDVQRTSLGESLAQGDYLDRMLKQTTGEELGSSVKQMMQECMSCPVFIGQGADWANTELLEVLVETSTNPAYSGIFGKFDEQSATVLADIRNTILVGGLKNIKMIQSNFSRD